MAFAEACGRIAKQIRELGYKGTLAFTNTFSKPGMKIAGMDNLEGCIISAGVMGLLSTAPETKGISKAALKFRENYFKRWPKQKAFCSPTPWGYNWVYYTTRAMEIAGTVTDAYKVRAAAGQAIAEKDYVLGIKGWTKGGRGYGYMLGTTTVKNGKVVLAGESILMPYPKELAGAGEK